MTASPLLELERVTKSFGPMRALDEVSLTVEAGEVHAVLGENGAGKSTLIKVMAGVHQPDEGEIRLDGRRRRLTHPRQAQEAGISVVYQEFSLLGDRTVAQNIFVGREPRRAGVVDVGRMRRQTDQLLCELDIADKVRPDTVVRRLPVALQQMVEIAKALSFDARVVVMDEPTAALSPAESEALFGRIRALVERDVAVVYVSHRLPEVFALADRITVLRDGRLVGTRDIADTDVDDVVSMMVGRELGDLFPPPATPDEVGDVAYEVVAGGNGRLAAIDLTLRRGEIVGVGGLEGAGQAELVAAVFGLDPFTTGTVAVQGRPTTIGSPRAAIDAGIGLVPADRKQDGLVLGASISDNVALPARSVRSVRSRITGALHDLARAVMERLDLRARSLAQPVHHLSGGNQQKVSLGRWVASDASILVLHEPTRGIDIQAKALTHAALRDLARSGSAVLVVSSDLPELVGLSDRVIVMRDGRFVGKLAHGCSEDEVMALAVHRPADDGPHDSTTGPIVDDPVAAGP